MSKQTDQLLLMEDEEDPRIAQKLKEEQAARIAHDKERLRLFQDLLTVPGFQLYMAYLQTEARAAFSNMERTENQLDHTRTCGTYTALINALNFVPDEIRMITEALEQQVGT